MPCKGLSCISDFDNADAETTNKEPSVELITTVKVPRHEYARLVVAKAKLDIIERMIGFVDTYALETFLKRLFISREEEDAK